MCVCVGGGGGGGGGVCVGGEFVCEWCASISSVRELCVRVSSAKRNFPVYSH